MWSLVDRFVAPDASLSFPLIVMTDNAAILYRAELAGVSVPPERWRQITLPLAYPTTLALAAAAPNGTSWITRCSRSY